VHVVVTLWVDVLGLELRSVRKDVRVREQTREESSTIERSCEPCKCRQLCKTIIAYHIEKKSFGERLLVLCCGAVGGAVAVSSSSNMVAHVFLDAESCGEALVMCGPRCQTGGWSRIEWRRVIR
jgi:hypothetical protein